MDKLGAFASAKVSKFNALDKQRKIAVAGVSTLGAAAIALAAVPGGSTAVATGVPAAHTQVAAEHTQVQDLKGTFTDPAANQQLKLDALAAKAKAEADSAAKKRSADAARKAAASRSAKKAASRSAERPQMETVAARTYANNLDGWIRHSLDIMHSKGIPGSYSGLHRNIIRESSGNPRAINNWDINAINGIPSKGLLQVIPPTFATYHVSGTSWNIYDPVANITAAANYAAHRYGTIDNVNSAY
ncbi:transglycosylase SLT domain-containing protein [Streptomyces sp. SID4985]|uniref:transglycosylase SLT domain-containing protein n=1 Tax=Streptomyces sp. SID4985 TaxID=2690292 RepID=UPI00136BA1F3|nr:transglycosylase SLT domain-containing protein [Streptomyces sp. SID4985]MYQ45258.1 transglycosylase SLT domain-containing protein [Streptomyces sp. SID4985]